MTSVRPHHVVAIAAPILFLAAGSWTGWTYPDQPLALALLLMAVLSSSLVDHRGWTLVVACLASFTLILPLLVAQTWPHTSQALWLGSLWLTAAFLNWDPRRSNLSVEELKRALHQGPTGLLITELDGTILNANAESRKYFDARLVGQNLQALADQGLWTIVRNHTDKLNAGLSVEEDFELKSVETNRHLTAHIKVASDHRGLPHYYVIQLSDLTREQTATRALQVASQQMRRILANSSDMVLIVSPRLRVTFANSKAVENLNTGSGQLTGQPVYNCLCADDRKRFISALKEFAATGRREVNLGDLQLQGPNDLQASVTIVRLHEKAESGLAVIFKANIAQLEELRVQKSSEARFSQVFHGSPDAILIIRASDEMIIDFNDGFTRLLGYQREDAIGEAGLDHAFWNNVIERDAVVDKLRTEREVIDYETTLRTVDGSLVHVEISLRYIEIDNELCILCIGRDITKRISAEAALSESEEKFEKIFSQSPDGIIILRQDDGTITDLNEVTLARTGYSRNEIIGQPIFDTPLFQNSDELTSAVRDMGSRGVIVNREITFTTKSGDEIPTLISASGLELSGEPHVMAISKDISKQRTAEERVRRSEQRFRGIFENAPIGIMLVDTKGHVFQANHTAASLLAYEESEIENIHISRLVPAEDRNNLKEILSEMTDAADTHKSERRMICRNGLEIWTNFHIALQQSVRGNSLYYIVQIADVTDMKHGQQRMEQMAFYDTLTNLANRRLFQDRLNQAIEHSIRSNHSSALLYLDLDNFKRVNDTLGHQTGDDLLREVASRLNQCVRKEDTVGRTGGDEFTILLHEIATPSDAGNVAQKILNRLREPITISGHPLIVTTSIGITVVPGDGLDPNLLMRNADLAMYKAKERGRNNYQFYSEDLNTNAAKRLRTEYEIRQALEKGEFELFYQPKVALTSGQIVGVESLIRWNHPERGLLGPQEFIEIAEETGSIIDMGEWIIETACKACRELSEAAGRPIQVAINISPRQFRDRNLLNTVRRCLRETQLNPETIEIEITETMLMHDIEAASATVHQLAEQGVKLAIDDFGTGYSSLNYLKRFPINTVKVDKSFIMDIPSNKDDMAITRAVIAMAHQLKMEVVAEGVETKQQFDFLAEHECEYAQGWLFAKPLPLPEARRLITDGTAVIYQS